MRTLKSVRKGRLLRLIIFITAVVMTVLFSFGCEPQAVTSSATQLNSFGTYGASKIHIVGLTEITPADKNEGVLKARIYVDIIDSFGSRIKSPGVFRFELYEFVPRSAQPMGKRILLWPDIDLTDAAENNSYWRDHLRAYEFELDLGFTPVQPVTFILYATCITPAGHRLNDAFQLEYHR